MPGAILPTGEEAKGMSRGKTSHEALSAEIRKCPQCGKAFIPSRKDQKYCSPACRKKASRERTLLASSPRQPAGQAKILRRRRKDPERLTQEDFEEMVDPLPSYEDMLRLTVRRLRKAIESDETSSRDLPAISRQLLSASKELQDYREDDDPVAALDDQESEVQDVPFSAEAI